MSENAVSPTEVHGVRYAGDSRGPVEIRWPQGFRKRCGAEGHVVSRQPHEGLEKEFPRRVNIRCKGPKPGVVFGTEMLEWLAWRGRAKRSLDGTQSRAVWACRPQAACSILGKTEAARRAKKRSTVLLICVTERFSSHGVTMGHAGAGVETE